MNKQDQNIKLQVLICTLGEAGIKRIVEAHHPNIPEVEYLVSWQLPDQDVEIPEELKRRRDFKIIKSNTIGIAINRNNAIDNATAPIAIMTDDDVTYTKEELLNVIKQHEYHTEADLITFKYASSQYPKIYPNNIFNLKNPPKGYYVTCFEITFKTNKIKNIVSFNKHFGFHTTFHGGEEDVFIYDAIKSGLNCIFIPNFLGTHNHSTTGDRDANKPESIITKGAIFYHTHKWTWPLRMMIHAKRNKSLSIYNYCVNWIRGVMFVIKNKIFIRNSSKNGNMT